jgi:hypothetical protein
VLLCPRKGKIERYGRVDVFPINQRNSLAPMRAFVRCNARLLIYQQSGERSEG